jgi:hypothetical protein
MQANELDAEAIRLPLEEMTLFEQVRELRACTMLIGIHGSGLVNGMFLRSGALMLQVLPFGISPAEGPTFFQQWPAMAGAHYLQWENDRLANTRMHWHFADDATRALRDKPESDFPRQATHYSNPGVFFAFWINQDTIIREDKFREWVANAHKARLAGSAP